MTVSKNIIYFKLTSTTAYKSFIITIYNFALDQEDTAEFFAEHKLNVVASLPCYSAKNVNLQRGQGVFDKSIQALLVLNSLGYSKEGTGLKLDLVYNPLGTFYIDSF